MCCSRHRREAIQAWTAGVVDRMLAADPALAAEDAKGKRGKKGKKEKKKGKKDKKAVEIALPKLRSTNQLAQLLTRARAVIGVAADGPTPRAKLEAEASLTQFWMMIVTTLAHWDREDRMREKLPLMIQAARDQAVSTRACLRCL